jgi:hypothetical protein
MHVRVRGLIAAAVLLAAGSDASAQRPSAKMTAEAKRLFLDGKAKFDAQQHIEALVSFHGSLGLVNRHSTVLFIGHCYRMLGWPDKARARYEQFLAMVEADRRLKVQATVIEDVKNLIAILKGTLDQVEQGKRQLEQGAAREALATFQQALQKVRWAEIQHQIARAHHKLGELKQAQAAADLAIEAYQSFVSSWQAAHPGGDPPDNDEIQRALTTLAQLKKTLEEEAAHGQLRLVGMPAGAAVMVDGARHGTAPLAEPLTLPVGAHRVEVAAAGFLAWSREVEIESGKEITVTVQLQPRPRPRPRPRPKPSGAWLAATITMAVLALGSEVMAWATWGQSTTLSSTDSDFSTLKSLTLTGHILAAAFAVATGASYYMYERSGRVPERRGASSASSFGDRRVVMFSGGFRF